MEVEEPAGLEKSIHTLSATPLKRPSKHRRRISSCESLSNASLDMPGLGVRFLLKGLALVGVAVVNERCRIRS